MVQPSLHSFISYTVIGAYKNGCLAEEIVFKYPSLSLPDVYAVLDSYLHHTEEIDAYLAERRQQIEEAEQEIKARFPWAGIREHLLARRAAKAEPASKK